VKFKISIVVSDKLILKQRTRPSVLRVCHIAFLFILECEAIFFRKQKLIKKISRKINKIFVRKMERMKKSIKFLKKKSKNIIGNSCSLS
jgi:uncharacterized C2H2 Zn-finger protein